MSAIGGHPHFALLQQRRHLDDSADGDSALNPLEQHGGGPLVPHDSPASKPTGSEYPPETGAKKRRTHPVAKCQEVKASVSSARQTQQQPMTRELACRVARLTHTGGVLLGT